MLKRLTSSPYVNLGLGLLLMSFSVDEAYEALSDGLHAEDLNSHLGMTVLGVFHALKAIPEVLDALEFFQRAKE